MGRYLDVFIAGIGGQGSLLIGSILAEAAIAEGLSTTWVPIYGVEKRGGDATVTVIISEEQVGSPVLLKLSNMIVMHQRMWDKYGDRIKPGGFIVVNSSIVDVPDGDYELLRVPASDMAMAVGSDKVVNMVLLGAFLRRRPVVGVETVESLVERKSKSRELAALNIEALRRGFAFE